MHLFQKFPFTSGRACPATDHWRTDSSTKFTYSSLTPSDSTRINKNPCTTKICPTTSLVEREHKSIVVSLLHVRPESPAVHSGHYLRVFLFRERPEHKPLSRSPIFEVPFAILELRRYA